MIKEINEDGNYTQLTVGELRMLIEGVSDDTEVKIATCHNPCGNIVEAGTVVVSSYGFFGSSIPCIVIEPAYTDFILDEKTRNRRISSIS